MVDSFYIILSAITQISLTLSLFMLLTNNVSNKRSNDFNQLKDLLSNGYLDVFFERITEIEIPRRFNNEVSLIKSRYHQLQTKERLGIITNENANVTKNTLVLNLLSMLDDIERFLEVNKEQNNS